MDARSDYDIFVSYRREQGAEAARLVAYALASKGLRVFLDVNSLGSGHFDDRLLDTIATTPNFLPILTEGALERCSDPRDWMRREILQALATRRNIVPVLMGTFAFKDDGIPEELRGLQQYNGVRYNHEYFDAMIGRLLEYCAAGSPGRTGTAGAAPATARSQIRSPDYVFIDFDGVLRTTGSPRYILDRKCLRQFEALMREHPSTRIVVTSSWRIGMTLPELADRFSPDIRNRIVGVTPVSSESDGPARHREILSYLKRNDVEDAYWLAIDDEPDRFFEDCRNLVVTNAEKGFDEAALAAFRSLLLSHG